MILISFKTNAQYLIGSGTSTQTWQQINSTLPIWQELWNSTVVCSLSILIILVIGVMAGFSFAKLQFRGGNVVFLAIVSAMMVPLQAILIPEFVNIAKTGLTNNYLGRSSSTRPWARRSRSSSSPPIFAASPTS